MTEQAKAKPDPLIGTGPLKAFFTGGLGALFGSIKTTPGKVLQMCEWAETDPRLKIGRWLRAGFQSVPNEVAGQRMREMLDRISIDCRTSIAQDFFESTPTELLELNDADLGKRVKAMYRPIKDDKAKIELIAKRFLTECAKAQQLN